MNLFCKYVCKLISEKPFGRFGWDYWSWPWWENRALGREIHWALPPLSMFFLKAIFNHYCSKYYDYHNLLLILVYYANRKNFFGATKLIHFLKVWNYLSWDVLSNGTFLWSRKMLTFFLNFKKLKSPFQK